VRIDEEYEKFKNRVAFLREQEYSFSNAEVFVYLSNIILPASKINSNISPVFLETEYKKFKNYVCDSLLLLDVDLDPVEPEYEYMDFNRIESYISNKTSQIDLSKSTSIGSKLLSRVCSRAILDSRGSKNYIYYINQHIYKYDPLSEVYSYLWLDYNTVKRTHFNNFTYNQSTEIVSPYELVLMLTEVVYPENRQVTLQQSYYIDNLITLFLEDDLYNLHNRLVSSIILHGNPYTNLGTLLKVVIFFDFFYFDYDVVSISKFDNPCYFESKIVPLVFKGKSESKEVQLLSERIL